MEKLEILSRVGDVQPTKYGIDLVAESIAEYVNGGAVYCRGFLGWAGVTNQCTAVVARVGRVGAVRASGASVPLGVGNGLGAGECLRWKT